MHLVNTNDQSPTPAKNRPLVFIPTYNEKENVEALCKGLLNLGLDIDILFMDDNSPDGTGEIIDTLSKLHSNVSVIHRTGKLGIGSAHFEGITWAYQNKYSVLITMDCDFTHPPEYVKQIIQLKDQGDVIVGSRYMSKNSLKSWNLMRRCLTNTGHLLTRVLLGMKYDATGALRLYRLDKIPYKAFELVSSKGYSFFFESLYVMHKNGFSITEFPISLPARTYGHSKMDVREVKRGVHLLFSTYFISLFNPEKFQLDESVPDHLIDTTKFDPQGWDQYWDSKKREAGGVVYDALASIYRRMLIRPSLSHFVHKYFPKGAKVLHAGCGSGQVDTSIRDHVAITGFDISVNALHFYKKTNGKQCEILHGSILEIPLPDNSVDGIYNLGVMEHFSHEDITKIFSEFRRVLKPKGRIIIFWPPEFGFSVNLFKVLKWFATNVLRKPDVKFHPDEISRIQSKSQAESIVKKANFTMLDYYFGPRDMFTQVVLVAEKPDANAELSSNHASNFSAHKEHSTHSTLAKVGHAS